MKYLKLMLKAPEFFNGKTIEHNGFTIEYNKNYIGEQHAALDVAMKEIEIATINPCHPTRLFKCISIYDNIDLDNLPYGNNSDEDSKIWFNLRDLGFQLQTKLGFRSEWKNSQVMTQGWYYRISPKNTQTLDNIRKDNK